jgi:hypothetical protein
MAKATAHNIRETLVKMMRPTTIVLELTYEEAECIQRISNLIGGSPLTTSRQLIDNVGEALEALGIEVMSDDPRFQVEDNNYAIYFVPYK